MPDFDERGAALVEVKSVFLVPAVRVAAAEFVAELGLKVTVHCVVILRTADIDVVQPEFRFVVPDCFPGLMSVGNVNVREPIVVEISRRAAPRPAGAREGIVQRSLLESTCRAR